MNIHHFILDGALWKLRDSRIASLLTDRSGKPRASEETNPPQARPANAVAAPWWQIRILSTVALRASVIALLFLWGGMDQIHFALGTAEGNLPALRQAARLNPYDSLLQARIALAEAKEGRNREEVAALTRAVAINPYNPALQQALARTLIQNRLYAEAYEHYAKMLDIFPRDPDALVNYGLLAARLGHPDVAEASWQKAAQVDPNQPNPHLYLAELLDQRGEFSAAARNWAVFLRFAAAHPDDPAAGTTQQISATIQLADDESHLGDTSAASSSYRTAIALAQRAGDAKLESLALGHLADLQQTAGDVKSAANSYQRGLALDEKLGEKAADPRDASFDWFNYGQFLRRHGTSDELSYACFLRAEELMARNEGSDLETVKSVRRQVESQLGKKAVAIQTNLATVLARAAQLPPDSF